MLSECALSNMDPLSALSLAACVVQFLDFGSKLVRETKEIAERGSTVSVEHLSLITVDLVGFNSALDTGIRSRNFTAGVGKEDQVSIWDVVRENAG